MNQNPYFFGYCFVRFSKLLALLALVAMVVGVGYLWLETGLQAGTLAYHPNRAVELHCHQLEQDLAFAGDEVSRLGPLDNLLPLRLPGAPATVAEFETLMRALQAVPARETDIKEHLTGLFAARTELLRGKIQEAIAGIDASRAAAQSDGQPAPRPAAGTAPPRTGGPPTVFDHWDANRLAVMHQTLNQAHEFLEDLAGKTEKVENQRLIHAAKASLNDLIAWLPDSSPSAGAPSNNNASTPLTTARENYQTLGRVIAGVTEELGRDWRLEHTLLETTQTVETEAAKCRNAEAGLKQLRWACAGATGGLLAGGLIVAFLVLVLADVLRSFFDTAANANALRELLSPSRHP